MNELTFGRAPGDERPVLVVRSDVAPGETSEQGAMPIVVRLLRVAKRRKWLLLGAIAIAIIIGLVGTLLMTPLYTAGATLEIQRENNRIVQVQGVQPEATHTDLEFYQTQYGLLRSRSLAERVTTSMRLFDNAAFFEMFGADEVVISIREGQRSSAGERQARTEAAAGI